MSDDELVLNDDGEDMSNYDDSDLDLDDEDLEFEDEDGEDLDAA